MKLKLKQVIAKLTEFGCTNIVRDGKYCAYVTLPNEYRGLFDLRDLLTELTTLSENNNVNAL